VCLLLHGAATAGDGVSQHSAARFAFDDGGGVVVAQQQSSANTDELTVVAVDAPSSLQLLHDVRMDAMGAVAEDDDGDLLRCCRFRNRSDADGNNCSVCLGTSEKLSSLPSPLGVIHGVG